LWTYPPTRIHCWCHKKEVVWLADVPKAEEWATRGAVVQEAGEVEPTP
jgi:hypothetical protein